MYVGALVFLDGSAVGLCEGFEAVGDEVGFDVIGLWVGLRVGLRVGSRVGLYLALPDLLPECLYPSSKMVSASSAAIVAFPSAGGFMKQQ